jgi:hypothetical protein
MTPQPIAVGRSRSIDSCGNFDVEDSPGWADASTLCFTLDRVTPFLQQPAKVAGQEQPIHQPTERSERRAKHDLVGHHSPAVTRCEPVIMGELPERPTGHHVAEIGRPIEYRYLG